MKFVSWNTAYRLAAALVLFLAGAAAQTFRRPAATSVDTRAPRFALMLYEAPVLADGDSTQGKEVQDWLDALRHGGHYVSAEHLAMGALEVERDTTWVAWPPEQSYGPPMLSALYIISAADEQEIISIARSSPHVQRGGRVIVRPVEEI